MSGVEHRLCLRVHTPKVVTYGEAFKIEYTVENVGTLPFPGGFITVEISWPSIENKVYQPTIIENPLPSNEMTDPNIMSQAPLLPGYTWFHVETAHSNDGNNVIVIGENGGQLWPHQPVGDGRFLKRPLHAVRARTPEEISNGRSLSIAAWSLVILILFQIINWILEYSNLNAIKLATSITFLVVPIGFLSYFSYKTPLPNIDHLPTKNDLKECEEAKLELDHNVKFLTFWAVLIFTSITGMLTISDKLSNNIFDVILERYILSIIYFSLLATLLFTMSRIISIYRENYAITFNGKIGRIMRDYINENKSIVDHLRLNKWYIEALALSLTFLVFMLLFLIKIKLF